MKKTAELRFAEKISVCPETGCWLWTGALTDKGYGQMWYEGRCWRANRLSHVLFVGPLEDDEVVLHACDTPPCVRPNCLSAGTQADNMKDMAAKGRWRNQWEKVA